MVLDPVAVGQGGASDVEGIVGVTRMGCLCSHPLRHPEVPAVEHWEECRCIVLVGARRPAGGGVWAGRVFFGGGGWGAIGGVGIAMGR